MSFGPASLLKMKNLLWATLALSLPTLADYANWCSEEPLPQPSEGIAEWKNVNPSNGCPYNQHYADLAERTAFEKCWWGGGYRCEPIGDGPEISAKDGDPNTCVAKVLVRRYRRKKCPSFNDG